MWAGLVWSLPFPGSPQTAVTNLQHGRETPPEQDADPLLSSVCLRQQPQGQGTPTCSWGEEHLTPASVCLPQWQQLRVSPTRAAAPQATATEQKREEALCGRGKLLVRKELQEEISKQSTVEEVAEKQEMSDGYCNANDPDCAAQCLLEELGEPTTRHRDNKASWGWREERHSACLQPGADARKCLAKCSII